MGFLKNQLEVALMESKDLIIIICAIIVGACIIAFAIAFADDIHDDEDDTVSTNCTAVICLIIIFYHFTYNINS